MKPIGRVIFEFADRSGYSAFVWDGTLELTLMSGGICRIRQSGKAYELSGAGAQIQMAAAPVMLAVDPTPQLAAILAAITAQDAPGSIGNVNVVLPPGSSGGQLLWEPNNDADVPPTITVTGGSVTGGHDLLPIK